MSRKARHLTLYLDYPRSDRIRVVFPSGAVRYSQWGDIANSVFMLLDKDGDTIDWRRPEDDSLVASYAYSTQEVMSE